jgi:predicted permease
MSSYLQDLRIAVRALRKRPAIAIASVLNLAIGLAVTMTVFGWIDNVLLQPVPGAFQPKSLVSLESTSSSGDSVSSPHPDLRDFQRGCPALSGLAGANFMPFTIGTDRSAHHVYGQFVSAGFFQVLGVQPALGRTFLAEEDRDVEGAYPYAVISHRLWRDRFRADSSIVGSAARVNGRLVTIVGVAPPPFRGSIGGLSLDIWVHLSMIHLMGGAGSWQAADRNARRLILVGRLRSDATLEQAGAQAKAVARRLAAEYPATHAGSSAVVLPLWRSHFGAQALFLSPLAALTGVSVLLLLVACANVANLLLARSLSRQAEYGLRLAMGAGPMRLFAQMFMEALLLAIAATGVGLLFAMWMGDTMLWLIPPTDWPLSSFTHVEVNPPMILLSFVLCFVVATLSAIVPALHVVRSDLAGSLRDSGRSSTSSRATRLTRRWLVIGEVALSCVAIIGAGLVVRSFRKSSQAKLGFDPGGVTVARLYLSSAGYSAEEERRFDRTLLEKLRDAPGVESASYAIELPLVGGGSETTEVQGYSPREGESMVITRNNVGPDYFRLLRIPQLAGIEFTEHDDQRGRPVVIVNRAFAQRFFGDRDPIGQRLRVAQDKRWSTIIGVVEDTRQGNPLQPPRPVYYAPFQQMFASGHENWVLIRTRRPAEALNALNIAVDSITPAGGLYQARLLDTYVQGSMFPLLVTASLMGTLGVISLILAGIGLYSVTAYAVGERTREIAVRMALGAKPAQVLRLVLRESIGMIGWGWLIGAAVTLAAARAVARMLAGIGPADPVAFGGAALFLGLVALIACLLPARRATRIDPVAALRCQ